MSKFINLESKGSMKPKVYNRALCYKGKFLKTSKVDITKEVLVQVIDDAVSKGNSSSGVVRDVTQRELRKFGSPIHGRS